VILVDTAIWIDHLHRADPELVGLLEQNDVATHSMIIGELALGSVAHRDQVLGHLLDLPQTIRASDDEVLAFVNTERLYGRGLSFVDAHLLAAARLTPHTDLWTRDKRLRVAAHDLGVVWEP
jgi:predicted nucleic acid-binding protein